MTKYFKRPLSIILAVLMVMSVFTVIPVISADALDGVGYLDENSEEQTADGVTELTSSSTELAEGWYAVTEDTTISDRIALNGDIHLILCDNALLTASEGIQVNGSGISLTIYAQSVGDDMGVLLIEEIPAESAGIDAANGSVTINGGDIIIDSMGSGISAESGDITINGGEFIINSNSESTADSAINARTVTINDGDITVNSTHEGIITSGGGSVTINGGDINFPETKQSIYTNYLTIDGASVTANAINYTFFGLNDITIRNSNVTAKSNSYPIYFRGDLTISDSEIDLSTYTKPRCTYGILGSETTSDVTIERSILSITSCSRGISTDGNITINGGYVSVLGNNYGIYSRSGNISLSWSTATDSIHSYNYNANGTITLQKQFDNGTTVLPAGTVSDLTTINSKTLTPPYTIDINVSYCENGTVKAPEKALEGDTVTLSVIPDEGYVIKSVAVNGEALAPVEGVYSFEMPDESVTVTAEFTAAPKYAAISYTYNVFNETTKQPESKSVSKTVAVGDYTDEQLVNLNMPSIKSPYYNYGEPTFERNGDTIDVTIPNTDKEYTVSFNGTEVGKFGYMETAEVGTGEQKSFVVDGKIVFVGAFYKFYVCSDIDITTDNPTDMAEYAFIDLNNVTVTDERVSLDMLATANVEKGTFSRMGVAFALSEKYGNEISAAVQNVTEGTSTSNNIAVHNSTVDNPNQSGQYQFRYAPYFAKNKASDKTIYFYTYVVDNNGNVKVSGAAQYNMSNLLA